jgi:hypothetical protein
MLETFTNDRQQGRQQYMAAAHGSSAWQQHMPTFMSPAEYGSRPLQSRLRTMAVRAHNTSRLFADWLGC